MATHKISMLGSMTLPDTSGEVFFEQASANFDEAENIYDHLLLVYNDSGNAADYCYGSFKVPENYSGTAKVELVWADNNEGTADLNFDFGYRAIATGESGAPTADQETVAIDDSSSATIEIKQSIESSLADNFSPSDTVLWRLARDSTSGTGIAEPVYVFELNFIYDD